MTTLDIAPTPEVTPPPLPAPTSRPRLTDRTLPTFPTESHRAQQFGTIAAVFLTALFAIVVFRFWAPADGGIDQNAYLVAGRLIAKNFSPRFDLPDPFAYVGGMFIRTDAGSYYPKYPFGLPLLYACVFWIFGATKALTLALVISPIGAILSVLGIYFLARTVAGVFASLAAVILLATSQVMLFLADNPNSHAACLACGIWGMLLLLRWWQTGSLWRGALAGFLLGYACLIRYSEGLLILPIAIAVLHRLRWSNWRSYLRNAVPIITWAIPVAALLLFNHHTLGAWTGYDSTNESSFGEAFTLTKLSTTWELMLRTLYDTGLFFVFPLGIAGMGMLLRRHWQLGLLIIAWFLPGVALYTAYYFSPDNGMAYARFFLTFLPPALVGVAVFFQDAMLTTHPGSVRAGRWSMPLTVGLIVAIGASVGAYRSALGMEGGRADAQGLAAEFLTRRNLADSARILADHAFPGSVVFAGSSGVGGGPRSSINFLQFAGDWQFFTTTAFSPDGNRRMGLGGGPGGIFNNADPNAPTVLQAKQRDYLADLYSRYNGTQLRQEQQKVITTALAAGHRVFVIASPDEVQTFEGNLLDASGYRFVTLARWQDMIDTDPAEIPAPGIRGGGRGIGRGGPGGGGPPGGGMGRNFPGRGGFGGPGGRGPGGFGGPGMNADVASKWQLVEICSHP